MLTTFLLWIFLSAVIWILIHFTYDYIIKSFSVKKIIHLGRFENEKYQEILTELKKVDFDHTTSMKETEPCNDPRAVDSTSADEMKKSLIEFVKETANEYHPNQDEVSAD